MCAIAAAVALAGRALASQEISPDLTQLSLEELMNIEVTSPTRSPERRFDVPDAVYVITQDDIRRSGVTSIPEALRLAPGVQVARIDANKWAIGIRGGADRLSRSVLVLIDGRTVYSPLFAGTYWEVQDTMLEDIDHIEVIRGPGGSLWGANAFHGIINIITKRASDTQGGLVSAGGGNEEQGFGGIRYGGKLDPNTAYRVYGKAFKRGPFDDSGHEYDDWYMGRVGFRLDRAAPKAPDTFTLQGDTYFGDAGSRNAVIRYQPPFRRVVDGYTDLAGGNVLGRWTHTVSRTADLGLQVYYDATYRNEENFREERHTVDFDFQNRFGWRWDVLPLNHEITWGLGYRVTTDATRFFSAIEFVPHGSTLNLYSAFLQDDIGILRTVHLVLGSKFEHNDFTGFEEQPSARLSWMPYADHMLWLAVGRAVRTPSRIERDVRFTAGPTMGVFPRIVGQHSFHSETTLSYQAGYRFSPLDQLFVDLVGFYQQYDNLVSVEPGAPFQETTPPPPHAIFPLFVGNGVDGETHGVEISTDAVLQPWWRITAYYAYLRVALRRDRDSHDVLEVATERNAPHHSANLLSKIDLPAAMQFDAMARYVDELPAQHVNSYFSLDLRLAKRVRDDLELSVVGQNLLAPQHREFGGGTQVVRGAYGQVRYWW